MTAQQEAGLEVLKRHIPGRKRERSQIASCFPLAFSSPLPTGFGACQTPAVLRSHLLRPALSCLCIRAVLHHPMYKTGIFLKTSENLKINHIIKRIAMRLTWCKKHCLMSYSDCFFICSWAISTSEVQSAPNEDKIFLHTKKKIFK